MPVGSPPGRVRLPCAWRPRPTWARWSGSPGSTPGRFPRDRIWSPSATGESTRRSRSPPRSWSPIPSVAPPSSASCCAVTRAASAPHPGPHRPPAPTTPPAGGDVSPDPTIRRGLRPGDLGMIVAHHGRVYGEEYGVDSTFEGHVASTVARAAARGFPSWREAICLVELDGEHAGSLALTDEGNGEAAIRWFVLSPEVRGRGLGRRLLGEMLAQGGRGRLRAGLARDLQRARGGRAPVPRPRLRAGLSGCSAALGPRADHLPALRAGALPHPGQAERIKRPRGRRLKAGW